MLLVEGPTQQEGEQFLRLKNWWNGVREDARKALLELAGDRFDTLETYGKQAAQRQLSGEGVRP